MTEEFTPVEQSVLRAYFTNTDKPVFALRNMPEVVKGALFARYSRSDKSLRRLFIDEFVGELPPVAIDSETDAGRDRAAGLYSRVLDGYGDDSVAQLGFAHVAFEGCSNLLTKIIERSRVMSYLEQSTRYIAFDQPPYRYLVPPIPDPVHYRRVMQRTFQNYGQALLLVKEHLKSEDPDNSTAARRARHAAALDAVRGMLPAATRVNLGACGSGQAWEALVVRMMASDLPEARVYGEWLLEELRKIIPEFVTRADVEYRGKRMQRYIQDNREATKAVIAQHRWGVYPENPGVIVKLADFSPEAEDKMIAAMAYPFSNVPYDHLTARVKQLTDEEKSDIVTAYVGNRQNRREKPGRALEEVVYSFDILADYGIFRDLQRHRMLTIDWQRLTPYFGYAMPELVEKSGAKLVYQAALKDAVELHDWLPDPYAPYAVSLAFRMRFRMTLNARELMHMVELRTQPQGHPNYRKACQIMHNLVSDVHPVIGGMLIFADHDEYVAGRLAAEQGAG